MKLLQRGRRRAARRNQTLRRSFLETLEPRCLLAADDVISVGRTLSSWSTADIVNNQLKITYSVYNQRNEAVSGISLATTLQAGVTFVDASIAPSQAGQGLSWDLGTLAPYGYVSIDVTVSFPGAVPLQLDNGASATGVENATPVSDSALPAVLRTDAIDPALLAATPDANFNDLFVHATAAMYDQDPAQIFQFMKQQIGYESYSGSLRGARGTLWSGAGNSIDQASLMIALLRESGVPAQYAEGYMDEATAQQLILSMFPEPLRVTGLIPSGATVGDPAHDQQLLNETQFHYWVQFDTGGGMQDADPTFANANLGDTFAPLGVTFAELNDVLRHKVHVQLDRELANTAAGLFGLDPLGVATVLDVTFNAVDLVGRPLTIGQFVNTQQIGSPVFSSITNTYSPYIAQGDLARPVGTDHLIRGTDFQEVITNFPFGSQVLTGLFLKIELSGPDGPAETFQRDLVDLIGKDVRTHGGSPNLNFSLNTPPTLSNYDFFTINALPSKIDPRAGQMLAQEVATLTAQASQLDPNHLGPDGVALLQQLAIAHTRLNAAAVFQFSDILTDQLAEAGVVRAYFDRPRIVITENRIGTTSGSDPVTLMSNPIDLRRDSIRVIVPPGQNVDAARSFRIARGFTEGSVENEVATMHVADVPGQATIISTKTVFDAAAAAGIGIVPISVDNISQLDAAAYSGEAKARITEALQQGKIVLAPEQAVVIDGVPRMAWYEIDPATGENVAVTEDGGHQAITEYTATQLFVAYTNIGFLFGLVSYLTHLNNCLSSGNSLAACKDMMATGVVTGAVGGAIAGFIFPFPPLVNIISNIISLAATIAEALSIAAVSAVADPPLPTQYISPPPLDDFNSLSGTNLATKTVRDPMFTLPYGGAQLPTVFRVGVKNTQVTDDRFTVQVSNVPAGWEAVPTVPDIGVPAGKIGEVGLVLRPTGVLPAPGTDLSFTVTVTSTSNPSITESYVASFTVPEVQGVEFSTSTAPAATVPGLPVTVNLSIHGVGNVPTTVNFDQVLPAGLTLSGLSSVVVNPGQTVVQTLTLTPAANTPLNTTLSATIHADDGGPAPQSIVLQIRVATPGADAIAKAITAAGQLDDLELSGRLSDLSIALTNLVQNATNVVYKSQALTALDSVIAQFAADPLFGDLVATLKTRRQSLNAANSTQSVQNATVALGNDLATLSQRLVDLANHRFELSLVSNTAIAQPLSPSTFQLVIHNTGAQTTTYVFSFENLPAGYDGSFSETSITLAPGESTPALGITNVFATLTPQAASQLAALGFSIRVTAQGFSNVTQTTSGSITPRDEFISVVAVKPDPPFAAAGTTVGMTAQVLNAVNRPQTAKATFEVRDASNTLLFTSAPVDVALTVQTSLVSVNLGNLDTTGYANGNYSIHVQITDALGNPIPGGTGDGNLLIGSPVTASIDASPTSVPPGTATVTNSLTISTDATLAAPYTLVGQVATTAVSSTIVVRGSIGYVAGSNGVDIVDVSNPAAPVLLSTFAQSLIVQGGYTVVRELPGDRIVVASTTNFNAPGTTMLVYSLADPLNPALISNTPIPQAFMSDLLISGSKGILTTVGSFLYGNNSIGTAFDQFGDATLIDFDAPGGPAITDRLEGTRSPPYTGNHIMSGGAIVNSTTAYIASSDLTGGNFSTGTGQIFVVNYADPSNLVLEKTLPIPGTTTLSHVGVQGNTALVVGSTRGGFASWNNVDSDPSNDSGNIGNMTFTTLDITDPENPVVVSTLVSSAVFPRGTQPNSKLSIVPLGGGRFAVSIGIVEGSPVLFLVDASDPQNIVASALNVNSVVSEMTVVNGQLYTTSADGLLIYDIGSIDTIPATASVNVPKGTGVSIVANSYSIPPTQIISGPDYDTLVWQRQLSYGLSSQTITWQSTLTNLQPGDTRTVTLGGSVDFTVGGTPGTAVLPASEVAVEQILSLTPDTNTVQPGQLAYYTLNLSNPTANFVTYNLSIQGVPSTWVNLPASVQMAPNTTGSSVVFSLTSEAYAALKTYGFIVTATTASGTQATVEGQLTLAGQPVLPDVESRGVLVSINPIQATVGRGTSTSFVVRLTNTGSEAQSFNLSVINLPPGATPQFSQNSILVPPGASNYREVTMTVGVPTFTSNGDYQFIVSGTDNSGNTNTNGSAVGTLHVVGAGVAVEFMPTSGTPNSTLQLKVTNVGQTTETFDLSLAGPAALVAALGNSSVTLDAGASQMVTVTVNSADFAFPGSLSLVATAKAHSNTAVQDSAEAAVNIAGQLGLTTKFAQDRILLSNPGLATFLLQVKNTGNLEDDYVVEIVGTTGPVVAHLVGFDGQPTDSIPIFKLPGLSTGDIQLNANVTADTLATVTVRVRSLTDGTIVAQSTATIVPASPNTIGDVIVLGSEGGSNLRSRVKVIDAIHSTVVTTFTPYGNSFHGGVRVATADLNHDGILEIITAPGPGHSPLVKVFDLQGHELQQYRINAYGSSFTGGVFVAVGDVDRDGYLDIITTPGSDRSAEVRVWRNRLNKGDAYADDVFSSKPYRDFLAFGSSFRGGVTVAADDFTGDRRADVVVGNGPGMSPKVRVFDLTKIKNTSKPQLAKKILEIHPFKSSDRGGVFVAAGIIQGDTPRIIVGNGVNGRGEVAVYRSNGSFKSEFTPYPTGSSSAPVHVSRKNYDGGKLLEILTAQGSPGSSLKWSVWEYDANLVDEALETDPDFSNGFFVA